MDFPVYMVCPLTISPSFGKRSAVVFIVTFLMVNTKKKA